MKDGYRYIDGKLEITDYSDNGVRELEYRHYQDNIDEILITENTIEELYKMKDEKEKDIKKDKDYIYKCKEGILTIGAGILFFTFFLGGPLSIILHLVGINYWITFLCTFIIISLFKYKFGISILKEEIKKFGRVIKGEELVLKTIKEELRKNKELLKELKNNMTSTKEDEIKNDSSYRQLNYVEKLEELKKELDLYYCVGFYESEMIESYNNGTLDTLEEKGFEKEEVKTLKRILAKRLNQEK